MQESQPGTPAMSSPTSFLNRMTNVFASPSQLFTEVSSAPAQTTSWLIPYLISILLAFVVTITLFNNPTIRQQILDAQEQGMKQKLADGKMTQQQYDQATSQMENMGTGMFVAFGGIFAAIAISALFFVGSLVLWVAARLAMKYSGTYTKILEVYGLSVFIGIFGTIITMIMWSLMNTMYATPSAALMVLGSFDPMNKVHKLLSFLNVFTIWQVVVLGIGLAKVSFKPNSSGIVIALAAWAVLVAVSIVLGIGA